MLSPKEFEGRVVEIEDKLKGGKMQIEMGMPVILKDDKGLEDYNLYKDQCGMANSVMIIEGEEYIYFMPETQMRMYAILSSRVIIDVTKLAAWEAEEAKDAF